MGMNPKKVREDMLRDEMTKYTELTGEDGNHTPIMKIGAYLDGYEKGLSVLDKIRAEIEQEYTKFRNKSDIWNERACGLGTALEIIDKYKAVKELEQGPKIGHWIVEKDCEGKTRKCICDRCEYETGKYTWHNPNYCPNCGAKMEG